jgi:hypothetical protein
MLATYELERSKKTLEARMRSLLSSVLYLHTRERGNWSFQGSVQSSRFYVLYWHMHVQYWYNADAYLQPII